jgi:hypothetical protein
LFVNSNKLTGTTPAEFGLLTKPLLLRLQSNQLTGTAPTEVTALVLLEL